MCDKHSKPRASPRQKSKIKSPLYTKNIKYIATTINRHLCSTNTETKSIIHNETVKESQWM